jgi:hypothetical protein
MDGDRKQRERWVEWQRNVKHVKSATFFSMKIWEQSRVSVTNKINRKMRKKKNTLISSLVPTPHVRVPNEHPMEKQQSAMPISSEVVSTARASTGRPLSLLSQSPEKPSVGAYAVPERSAKANRPVCTTLGARPNIIEHSCEVRNQ